MTPPTVFELIPGLGAGVLRFNAARMDTRAALGRLGFSLKSERDKLDYFCDASIQVEYTSDNLLQFVGFSCDARTLPTFHGVDVFSITASERYVLVAAYEPEALGPFNVHGCLFPTQLIALWDADEQYDHRTNQTRCVWGQVGIGSAEYRAAIEAIGE